MKEIERKKFIFKPSSSFGPAIKNTNGPHDHDILQHYKLTIDNIFSTNISQLTGAAAV